MFRTLMLSVCLLACVGAQAQQKYQAYPYNKPAPSQDDTPYTPTPTQTSLFPNASTTIGIPMPKAPTPEAPNPQAPTPNAPNPKSAYDQPPIQSSGSDTQQPTSISQPQGAAAPIAAQAPAVSVTVRPPDPAKQAQQDQEIQNVKDHMFEKPKTQ